MNQKNSFIQKDIFFFLVFFLLIFFIFSPYIFNFRKADQKTLNSPLEQIFDEIENIKAISFLVGDLKNNKIILSKNENIHLYPASISKLILAMVVIDNLSLEKEIKISSYALSAEGDSGGLKEGETIKAIDLLKVLLITSSNDAALAFEEELKNQNKDIVDLMNKKVQEIGLKQTAIFDPRGIDRKGNFSTASDLFLLAKEICYNYPLIGEITRKNREIVFSSDQTIEHILENTNFLTQEIENLWGGKTGTTPEAGDCLLTIFEFSLKNNYSKEDKFPFAIIVLGSSDRFNETKILYNFLKDFYLRFLK